MEDPKSLKFFTSQFQAKKLWLDFEEPTLFGTGQCGRLQALYIFYRFLWATNWVCMFTVDLLTSCLFANTRWALYLSNWTYIMLMQSAMLQFAASIYHVLYMRDRKEENKAMPFFYKLVWLTYYIPTTPALVVSCLFWMLHEDSQTLPMAGIHGLISVYVFTDIFITGVPIRILHFFHGLVLIFIYLIFTLIQQLGAGGPAVYAVINWHICPGPTVGLFFGLLGAAVGAQMFLFFLYWIRVLLYTEVFKCGAQKEDPDRTFHESDLEYDDKEGEEH